MAAFTAEGLVEALDYDLSGVVPGFQGVIEEPSDKKILQFGRDIAALEREQMRLNAMRGLPDDAPLEKYAEAAEATAIARLDAGLEEREAKIFAALCGGKPAAAQLMKVPPRYRRAFYRWISTEVMSPEAGTGAGQQEAETPS